MSGPHRRPLSSYWQALRAQRRQTVAQRQRDDQAGRGERNHLRSVLTATVVTTAWHTILIITDNSIVYATAMISRTWWMVPMYQVVAALREQLPESIAFVVSDRGVHVTAHSFQAFARQQGFVQRRSADARRKRMGLRSGWCADRDGIL